MATKSDTKKKTTTKKTTTSKPNTKKEVASTKKTSTKKSTPKTKKVVKKEPVVEEPKVIEKTKLKTIYIFIIIVLSVALLITSTIEIINILKPSENLLPTKPPVTTQTESELDKINKLFSEDIDLSIPRKENNNNEIVGRIEIPGVFNLLLTQTKDNDYYIEYNIKKKRSNKGTEFIDFRNKFTDNHINIYGHNSRLYDLPFKKLEEFLNEDFFNNNEYLLFQTDEVRRVYKIVAITEVKKQKDYEHMIINSTNQEEHITKLLEDSINKRDIKYDKDTNIIVLQTCVRQRDGNYYLLIGFEVK